jgi:phage shock protein C
MATHLYRSRDDRMLAGVAGGLAELWDADPSLIRILWALLVILTGGIALVVYIVMALVVPEEDDASAAGFAPGGAPIPGTGAAGVGTPAAPPVGAAAPTEPGAAAAAEPGAVPGWNAATDWRSQRRAERDARRAARHAYRRTHPHDARTPSIVIGGILILIGVVFLVREYLPTVDFDYVWPLALVVLGAVVLVSALRPGGDGS